MRTEITNRPQTGSDFKNDKKNKQEIAAAPYTQLPNAQQNIGFAPQANRYNRQPN